MDVDGNVGTSIFKTDVLAGRVAMVTGGGSGIGFEIARQLGKHGVKGVVLFGRRQNFLEEAVSMLAKEGVTALASPGDNRKGEDCAKAVQLAVDKFGSMDILINSAAGNFLVAAEDLSPNGFKTVMDIDTLGTYTAITAAFPALKNSKFGGCVVSISAWTGHASVWWQTAPVAAKAAIDAMTRNLAMEWAEYKIRVNGITPGLVGDTPGATKIPLYDDEKSFPLGRLGTKGEIAQAVIFQLAHPYVTGEVWLVDGGYRLYKPMSVTKENVRLLSRSVEKTSRAMGPGAAAGVPDRAPSKL